MLHSSRSSASGRFFRINDMTNALTRYVRESKEELMKVTWPSRQQVVRDTLTVLGISAVAGVLLGALDFGFSRGVQELITRFAA